MGIEEFKRWVEESWNDSYFNPWSPRFVDTWDTFDRGVKDFDDQILIVVTSFFAALATFFVGGLGGVAAFRAMTERYAVTPIGKNLRQSSEEKTSKRESVEDLSDRVEGAVSGPRGGLFATGSEKESATPHRYEQLICLFPKKLQNQKLKELLSKWTDLFPDGDFGGIIHAFLPIPEEKRMLVVGHVIELGADFSNLVEYARLIEFFHKIEGSAEKPAIVNSTVKCIIPWVKGIKEAQPIGEMIELFSSISENDQNIFFECAQVIGSQLREEDRLSIVKTLKTLKEQKQDIVLLTKTTAPLLQGVKNVFLIPDILEQVQRIPEGQREKVIALVQPLIRQLNDSYVISQILRAVVDFPPEEERKKITPEQAQEERKNLLEGITEYLGGLTNGDQILRILYQIADLSAEERFKTVSCAIPHAKKIREEDREYVVQILKEFGKDVKDITTEDVEKKLELMQQVPKLLAKILDPEGRKKFVEWLNMIPSDQRSDIIQLLQEPLSKLSSGDTMGQIIYAFFLIAPDLRNKALRLVQNLFNQKNLTWQHIIAGIFHPRNDEIRRASIPYLTTMLQSIPDQEILSHLAKSIWNSRALLRLVEEQELAQLAFRLDLLCQTANKNDPFSAFGLYRKLVETSKHPSPVITTPVFEIPFEKEIMTQKPGGGFEFKKVTQKIKVSLNQKGFEEMVGNLKKVKFSDLPKGIGVETIDGFFKAFEKRIASLPEGQRKVIEKYIKEQGDGDYGWETLKGNLLNNDILGWAGVCGSPDEVAPMVVVQLYSILNYIQNVTEDDLLIEWKGADGKITLQKRKSPLTPQEEALFGVARAIHNCSIGKRDGVKTAYFAIPAKFKIQAEVSPGEATDEAAYVANYVSPIIQEYISELFTANNSLMKALTGSEGGGAETRDVHEIRYVKSLMAKRVGLNDDVVFDVYIQGKSHLHQLSLKEALTIYFQHASPEGFIKKIKNCLKRDIKAQAVNPGNFTRYLDPTSSVFWDPVNPEPADKVDLGDVWVEDEDEELGLDGDEMNEAGDKKDKRVTGWFNDLGVYHLLVKLGLFHPE